MRRLAQHGTREFGGKLKEVSHTYRTLEVSLEVFHWGSRQVISKGDQDINAVNGTRAQLEHLK